jgi:formate dehydrogenase (coenzyme F420) beta subunit
MIETTITVESSTKQTIQALLRSLLERGTVDALLVPMTLPGGTTAPTLVSDPQALDQADPLAPVLPINAARAASQLTMTAHSQKLGLVLRSCEIRALVELVKFQQASLDQAFIIGLDCLGTYPLADYQAAEDKDQLVDELLAGAATGEPKPHQGLAFRSACQICEQPLPEGYSGAPEGQHVALTLGLVGLQPGTLYLKARDDLAEALDLQANGTPAGRKAAAQKLITARTQARDEAFAQLRQRIGDKPNMQGLLQEFSACIRCHNCMINCPICYCRECIFRTPTFEHESQLYYQWAERKGTVRMLPDTLLFHLTRLNHMVTSCVGCGLCTDACPADIPVATVFRAVGQNAQAIFDYHPGRSLDEAAPVQEFREDELTAMGERPGR